MRQFPNYGDDRNKGWCVYCGGSEETRDHVPSRVFLDEPYPGNLPVVPSCQSCNNSYSLDEEYLACLIECARSGSAIPTPITRPKIARILRNKVPLISRLAGAREECADGIYWAPEDKRVRNVISKLARGHVAFEQNEPQLDEPRELSVFPLCAMTPEARTAFEAPPEHVHWPEVGSRAMNRIVEGPEIANPWIEVQPGNYRYVVYSAPWMVRIIIAEYLGALVVWD